MIVPKLNGTISLYLGPTRINQALIRPVNRGPTVIDIFPKLSNAWYLILIGSSSGIHKFKTGQKSSYLETFTWQFGRLCFSNLSFRVALTLDIFQ